MLLRWLCRCWLALFLSHSAFTVWATASPLLQVNFDDGAVGPYQAKQLERDWPQLKWHSLLGRADIVQDDKTSQSQALKIYYPKGSVGPSQGGGQFLQPLPPSTELWLSYQVKFDTDFDFRLGGKLPGLTSGGATYTGGVLPTEGQGWSARYMWRKNGEAVVYLYYMDMPGKWGEDLALAGFHFQRGQWHTLVQRIRVNTLGKADGLLEVWVDGEKRLSRRDIQYRGKHEALIDSLYFSTFHGGNTPEWGPKHDSYTLFDNFVVSTKSLVGEMDVVYFDFNQHMDSIDWISHLPNGLIPEKIDLRYNAVNIMNVASGYQVYIGPKDPDAGGDAIVVSLDEDYGLLGYEVERIAALPSFDK